jgi:DNA ligase 4
VELIGADFNKSINIDYFTLRFPRVLKIYDDRSFKDTVSFKELQKMAKRYKETPENSEKEKIY